MSTVAPSNPALVQLLAQAANAPTVQIAQPPPQITALPSGSIVEAIVLPQKPVQSTQPAPQPQAQQPAPTTAPPPAPTSNLTLQTGAGVITARAHPTSGRHARRIGGGQNGE